MAYRSETEQNGKKAIVIDGWEKGIADSPYSGITSMKNLNSSFLIGGTYVNYKRLAATITGGTMGVPKFYTQSPGISPTYYMLDDKGQVWSSSSTTTWTLLTGNHTAGSGLGYGIAYFKDYLFVFGTTYVDVCGNGTGVGGITSGNWASVGGSGYYTRNWTGADEIVLSAAPGVGAAFLTLNAAWPYISGSYQVTIGNGAQTVTGTFTNGSTNVPITPVVSVITVVATIGVIAFTLTTPPNHMAIVGINDILYFCNGNTIGAISVPDTSPTAVFNVSNFSTQQFEYAALTLRSFDRAIWLCELGADLEIAVQNYIYSWDKLGTAYTAIPINENPSRMINILNNIYIFAGQKGDIYLCNGYSVSLFKKIPDSFLNAIDPSWIIGGMMFHRNKLYFGAVGSSQASSNKVQGIFSLVLNSGVSSVSLETAGAINFESQNSWGISPTSAADATGILIDLNAGYGNSLDNGVSRDSYISAWYNNTVAGVDYNDGTLWQNYEPRIETDLIPVGTFLQARNFEQCEYKLDKPLANGDSIRLSYRTDISSSYTLVGNSEVTGVAGTTTATSSSATQVLSDTFNSNINLAQWVQFLVEFKCASSSSSFIRLREIRIR